MNTDFGKYLKEHREDLYEDLPEGALDRFLERLPGEEKQTSPSRRWVFAWKTSVAVASLAAAAVLVAVFVFSLRGTGTRGGNYFAAAGNDPQKVYSIYLERLEAYSSMDVSDSSLDDVIRSITFENIPLLEQLPAEMPLPEKAEVLKRHYGALLDGVDKVVSGSENNS